MIKAIHPLVIKKIRKKTKLFMINLQKNTKKLNKQISKMKGVIEIPKINDIYNYQ